MHARDSRFIRLILLIFFLLAAGYAAYEAQGLLYGPEIHLAEASRASPQALTSIRGTAERITELRLNGKTISVTEDGAFDEPYLLAPGSNRIILEARDARGRTTTETLDIVYLTSDTSLQSAPQAGNAPIEEETPSPAPASTTGTTSEDVP